jgi:hypothetical protein
MPGNEEEAAGLLDACAGGVAAQVMMTIRTTPATNDMVSEAAKCLSRMWR